MAEAEAGAGTTASTVPGEAGPARAGRGGWGPIWGAGRARLHLLGRERRAGGRLTRPPSSPPGSPPTGSPHRDPGPGSRGSARRALRARPPTPRLPRASQGRRGAESAGLGALVAPGPPAAAVLAAPGRPGPPLPQRLASSWPEIRKGRLVRSRRAESSWKGLEHLPVPLLGAPRRRMAERSGVQSNGWEVGGRSGIRIIW